MRTHTLALAGCLMMVAAVQAQDWPQWRGPARDAKVTGFTAPAAWPKELKQTWKVTIGIGESTPALVGDKLYVCAKQGTDEMTICLNAADGKEVWSDKYPAPAVTGPAARNSGPRSSPAVADGKVVALGVGGMVSCYNAADGKLLWRKDSKKEGYGLPRFFTSSSPLILDGMAIVLLGGPGGKGALVAYDLTSGDQKWACEADGAAYASPAVVVVDGTKLIVTPGDKKMIAVAAADGKLAWETAFAPAGMAYNAPSPVVDGATVIYMGQGRGTFAVKFEKEGDKIVAKELWKNTDVAPQFSTPVLKDGLLYGLSGGKKLYCLNAKDGKEAWVDQTARPNTYGAIVDAGTVVIALMDKGQLVVIEPNDKAFKQAASITLSGAATLSYPVLSGKRMFVREGDSLMLYTLE